MYHNSRTSMLSAEMLQLFCASTVMNLGSRVNTANARGNPRGYSNYVQNHSVSAFCLIRSFTCIHLSWLQNSNWAKSDISYKDFSGRQE